MRLPVPLSESSGTFQEMLREPTLVSDCSANSAEQIAGTGVGPPPSEICSSTDDDAPTSALPGRSSVISSGVRSSRSSSSPTNTAGPVYGEEPGVPEPVGAGLGPGSGAHAESMRNELTAMTPTTVVVSERARDI